MHLPRNVIGDRRYSVRKQPKKPRKRRPQAQGAREQPIMVIGQHGQLPTTEDYAATTQHEHATTMQLDQTTTTSNPEDSPMYLTSQLRVNRELEAITEEPAPTTHYDNTAAMQLTLWHPQESSVSRERETIIEQPTPTTQYDNAAAMQLIRTTTASSQEDSVSQEQEATTEQAAPTTQNDNAASMPIIHVSRDQEARGVSRKRPRLARSNEEGRVEELRAEKREAEMRDRARIRLSRNQLNFTQLRLTERVTRTAVAKIVRYQADGHTPPSSSLTIVLNPKDQPMNSSRSNPNEIYIEENQAAWSKILEWEKASEWDMKDDEPAEERDHYEIFVMQSIKDDDGMFLRRARGMSFSISVDRRSGEEQTKFLVGAIEESWRPSEGPLRVMVIGDGFQRMVPSAQSAINFAAVYDALSEYPGGCCVIGSRDKIQDLWEYRQNR
ncbi:hypothetical protein PSPO01_15238 [Paraphaeosphaeria sporulosa]